MNVIPLSGILCVTMPAIQRSEFALALNQVASERGVDVSVVLDTVKNAILAAYRKDHPGAELEEFTAELNPNTGEAKIMHDGKDVTPPGFGRIAAQTAKQVILQKIREKEKEAILTDYKVRMGTVVSGMVLRFAGPNIIMDVGKTEAVMPPAEQVPNEKYHLNQRLSIHLLEIREGMRGEEIIVSRASNGLLEGLFKREVPEVAQGSVEIKAVVREPGNRAKVAVYSNQSGIDPVGSCVGQKGVRIQAVIQETGGIEKIDIIQFSDDLKTYIANALSPAKNVKVTLNEEDKVAQVIVPQDELSLAIGKDGQNVRLASKLTGVRIEIEGSGELSEAGKEAERQKEKDAAKAAAEAEEATAQSALAESNAADAEEAKGTDDVPAALEDPASEASVNGEEGTDQAEDAAVTPVVTAEESVMDATEAVTTPEEEVVAPGEASEPPQDTTSEKAEPDSSAASAASEDKVEEE